MTAIDHKPLTAPTVHLNGTSREALLTGYCDAMHALRRGLEALDNAAPNGRDYYPQGPQAYQAAHREHIDRRAAIARVIAELNQLAETVADA